MTYFGEFNSNFEELGNIFIGILLNEHKGTIHFHQYRNKAIVSLLASVHSKYPH